MNPNWWTDMEAADRAAMRRCAREYHSCRIAWLADGASKDMVRRMFLAMLNANGMGPRSWS